VVGGCDSGVHGRECFSFRFAGWHGRIRYQMAIFSASFFVNARTTGGIADGRFLLIALASIAWIGGSEVMSRLSTLADYKRMA